MMMKHFLMICFISSNESSFTLLNVELICSGMFFCCEWLIDESVNYFPLLELSLTFRIRYAFIASPADVFCKLLHGSLIVSCMNGATYYYLVISTPVW